MNRNTSRKLPAMTSSDQCFCLPFYPGLRRAALYRELSQRAPERCKHAAGLGLRRGARAGPRGHRGCTIRASTGVSDLHSPQRDENPPAADGARRAGGLPRRQGVFGGGESERAGARMKAGGGTDTCPRHRGPAGSSSSTGDGHLLRDSRTRGPAAASARLPRAGLSRWFPESPPSPAAGPGSGELPAAQRRPRPGL